MASKIQIQRLIPVPLPALCAALLVPLPTQTVSAHQLTNINGTVVPHQHVYKRRSYGNGYVVGHVAPTRHGNDMIIWSPAPSNAYGNSVPQVQVVKPDRRSRLQQRREARTDQQIRQLNRRDDRR